MLEVKNLTKKYKGKTVLDGVSFSVNKGESVAIVGRNGCGKTTLLKILAGALKPDSGEIRYFGENPLKGSKVFRKYCGYVSQESPLYKELTVKDHLKFWGVDKCPNYKYILDRFELNDIMKVRVDKLSGGMKRRLQIACAIASWPPILLLDEPTTALDIYYKENILGWLSEYRNLSGIVLLATHEEKEILSCDRALVFKDGLVTGVEKTDHMMDDIRQLI